MNNAPDNKAIESVLRKRLDYNPSALLFPELEPPVVAAFWPATGTRDDEALQALIEGKQNQADYWRGWRLAAYVNSLRRDGWAIFSRSIIKPGCRREIAEYELDRTDPGTAAALASRQKGSVDLTLAGLLAFAGVCAVLLLGVPL